MRNMYKPSQLAFVIPTRNRPEKIRNLLNSMAGQPACGRIVIVDSGETIQDVINDFLDKLPIAYRRCAFTGQIAQRNYGISLLDDTTPLVACLDDDIVLEDGCIAEIYALWNMVEPETAGIGFNIINQAPAPTNLLRRITLQTSRVPGKVLISGITSDYHGTTENMRTEWLCGGATTWRLEILRQFPHASIKVRWAIGEDLIYSYPIGRRHPLYVCASARVRHEHVYDYSVKRSSYYHGLIQTLMRYRLIIQNRELSWGLFAYSVLSISIGKLLVGLLLFRPAHIRFALGQLHGLVGGTFALARGGEFADYIAQQDSMFS